jgi:hypothetical protein
VAEHLIEEPHRAAVDHVGENDVIAGLQQSKEEARDGRHTGGVTDGRRGVFEHSQRLLECGDSGV